MSEEQKCLICGQDMELELYETTSYYQCSADPTHRMNLTEFSDLIHEKRSEKEIKSAMQDRAQKLQKLLDEKNAEQ